MAAPPGCARQHTPPAPAGPRAGGARALVAAGLALLLACASPPPPPEAPDAAAWTDAERARADALERRLAAGPEAPAAEGALRVRLAFGDEADLDLYVSDPAQETVYYANTPSRSGGALVRDRRCPHPAPRVETVRFDAPPPGRYRVGVDAPRLCNDDDDPAPVVYVVSVERPGRPPLRHRGRILPVRFDPIVLEFDLP